MMGRGVRSLTIPEGHVELAALAATRGVPPGKFIDGPGVARMAVARAHDDPVALAATAARRRFTTADIDPTTIKLRVVRTGSAVDHSRPVAADLHRLLGLPRECRVFEVKQA